MGVGSSTAKENDQASFWYLIREGGNEGRWGGKGVGDGSQTQAQTFVVNYAQSLRRAALQIFSFV